MKIDAHQHFWIFDPVRDAWIDHSMAVLQRDFMPADLAPLLQQAGIDGCVAVQADQSEHETNFLLELAEQNDFIKKVVGWVDLCAPDVDRRLEQWQDNPKLAGFRHILQAEPPEKMATREFRNGIGALCRLKYTYDMLIYPHHLPAAYDLAKTYSYQPFVIDHLAKPFIKKQEIEPWKQHIQAMASLPNVYCKLSGLVTEADHAFWEESHIRPYMDVALEAFGPDRLMFGSDWPVCLLAADYQRTFDLVKNYIQALSESEQNQIMGKTACRFYNISN
ncbi:MAG: amidohydrolase family protein [Saprospiraceae bacterium]|nr:amidohydrolase family protein [Saprospiraceae bacterium]